MPVASDIQTVAFVSLGCPKNLVDSEKMLGLLAEDGIMPIPEAIAAEQGADAMVINTCGFLEASKIESLEEIARAAELKKQGKVKRIVVAGCLVQRHRAKMLDWCPDIDALIGVFDRDHIVDAVRSKPAASKSTASGHGRRQVKEDVTVALPVYASIAANATIARRDRGIDEQGYYEDDSARLRLTPRHYAYLRMSEGCNQNCAFCTIPSIRGKMRSKPVPHILRELDELMSDGAYEINLIGQDTTSFGNDIAYEPGLVGLLEALNERAQAHGGAWLRLMYAYPSCFTDQMIDAIARLPHVVKYIDMPLQHINDTVLNNMRRHTSRKLIETLLTKLRDRVPGIAIRTTFISGYPGETDAQHEELVAFVREFGFENMGVFGYSPEPGTPAGSLHADGHAVPQDVIEARIDELMRTQQQVVFDRHRTLAEQGRAFDVLIEGESDAQVTAEDGRASTQLAAYVGRTYAQAPQIDGQTLVISEQRLSPGELIRCRVTDYEDYDLIAQPVADLEKTTSLPILS